METQDSRPRIGVILSVPMSLLAGVLFFMPWLSVSCDAKGLAEMAESGAVDQLPTLPPQMTGETEIAQASGLELACGEATPVGMFKGAASARSGEQGLPSRWWLYGGVVLPLGLLVVCGLCLAGTMQAATGGKVMFFLAFAGVGMMYTASRISYADDAVAKARSEFVAHAPPGAVANMGAVDEQLDQVAEKLADVVITSPTGMLWLTMGAYGVVCICAACTIGSPTPASEKAIAAHADPSHHPQYRPASAPSRPHVNRRRGANGDLPQFGPDLFTPAGSDEHPSRR